MASSSVLTTTETADGQQLISGMMFIIVQYLCNPRLIDLPVTTRNTLVSFYSQSVL